jgi:hypothetical protein
LKKKGETMIKELKEEEWEVPDHLQQVLEPSNCSEDA